jgi:hypothetical protein
MYYYRTRLYYNIEIELTQSYEMKLARSIRSLKYIQEQKKKTNRNLKSVLTHLSWPLFKKKNKIVKEVFKKFLRTG